MIKYEILISPKAKYEIQKSGEQEKVNQILQELSGHENLSDMLKPHGEKFVLTDTESKLKLYLVMSEEGNKVTLVKLVFQESVEQKINDVGEKVKNLQEEIEYLKRANKSKEQRIVKLENSVKKFETENGYLFEIESASGQRIDQADAEITELRLQINKLEERIEQLEKNKQ
ncbi:hypothetical protein [Nitrosopumilus sp.]|uniref:hypothetical protein n=1 Tax=Nitrosopumilus sp. TaxID=2024843 RepID=UPI003D09D4CC